MVKLKVAFGIVVFYIIVFHFLIRLNFFPSMPAEGLIGLVLLMMMTYNVVAYFQGWTMHIQFSHTKPDAPKGHRFFALFASAIALIIVMYVWIKLGINS